jgi:hypothetical protein
MSNETEVNIVKNKTKYPVFSTNVMEVNGENDPDRTRKNILRGDLNRCRDILCVGVGDDWYIQDVLKEFGSNETLTVKMTGGETPHKDIGIEYEVSVLEINKSDLTEYYEDVKTYQGENILISEYINDKSSFLQGTKKYYWIDGFIRKF